jgi:hypothetical protein
MKNSQHHFISQAINANTTFIENIQIPFTPTRLIVHYVKYLDTVPGISLTLVRCNQLINGQGILTCFSDNADTSPSQFIINKPVQGDYTFELLDIDKDLDATIAGSLVIDLEFIED